MVILLYFDEYNFDLAGEDDLWIPTVGDIQINMDYEDSGAQAFDSIVETLTKTGTITADGKDQ